MVVGAIYTSENSVKRGSTGQYENTATGDEAVRAFVPAPLPSWILEGREILRSVLVSDRYFSNESREVLLRQGFVNREAFIYSEKLLENP